MLNIFINDQLCLTGETLSFTAERSSGPGGQNVNKVESKVRLRFDFERCEQLSLDAKSRLRSRYARRLDASGALVITSQVTRDQQKNLRDACERLRGIVESVLSAPVLRKKTKPSRAANARRLTSKRLLSEKKAGRRARPSD